MECNSWILRSAVLVMAEVLVVRWTTIGADISGDVDEVVVRARRRGEMFSGQQSTSKLSLDGRRTDLHRTKSLPSGR